MSDLIHTIDRNLSAATPLTPLDPDRPARYTRCNLANRRVADGSLVEDCQVAQVLIVDETPHYIGRGVLGEVTEAMVQAVAQGASS